MTMMWQAICKVEDLVKNSGICALVDGKQVAIFYVPNHGMSSVDGELFAINNWDPIGKANVLSRGIIAGVGERLTIASPLYKQHYCLQSGECLEEEGVSVGSHTIKIDGDTVVMQMAVEVAA